MSKTLTSLVVAMLLVGGLQGCQSTPVPSTSAQNLKNPDLSTLEQSIYQQINQYRYSHHLAPLVLDARISEQARIHSQNMAQKKVAFSHNGFEQRIEAIAVKIPYSNAAENVAYNQGYSDPATEAVKGWIKSTGHRHNIEGKFNLTGIGVSKNTAGEYYFTQIFILQR